MSTTKKTTKTEQLAGWAHESFIQILEPTGDGFAEYLDGPEKTRLFGKFADTVELEEWDSVAVLLEYAAWLKCNGYLVAKFVAGTAHRLTPKIRLLGEDEIKNLAVEFCG